MATHRSLIRRAEDVERTAKDLLEIVEAGRFETLGQAIEDLDEAFADFKYELNRFSKEEPRQRSSARDTLSSLKPGLARHPGEIASQQQQAGPRD